MSTLTANPNCPVPGGVILGPDAVGDSPSKIVGDYIIAKYRHRAQQVGVQTVARQLRKQGFEPEIAVLILAVRP